MPVIKSNEEQFPPWSEVKSFNIILLSKTDQFLMKRSYLKELLYICQGSINVLKNGFQKEIQKGEHIDLTDEEISLKSISDVAVLLLISGEWSSVTGLGVFELRCSDNPRNTGDPANYYRNTDFDNHFHDFDEYWFIISGKGVVVSEDKMYNVGPGNCILTKKGDHHDFPVVTETILGVYFETTLKGKKRMGHLLENPQ